MNETIRVMLVDDHAIVREGVRKLLASESGFEVVGEAEDGRMAIETMKDCRPDVIVLDISMPKLGGLETIRLLLKENPKVKIVILSMYGKETFTQEALRSGVHAYVLKGDPGETLIAAIRAVKNGKQYFSEEIKQAMMSAYISSVQEPEQLGKEAYYALSDREKQVFRMMMDGMSTVEISKALGLSPKTGEKHRTNIVKKLGMSNAVDLVKYAIRIGLIDPDN